MDIETGHVEAFEKINQLPTSIKTRLV